MGEDYVSSSNEEYLRAVRYVRDDEVVATDIVYAGNFYFQPPPETAVTGDVFPENGHVVESGEGDSLIAKNAVVFDTFGISVFAGDLGRAALEDLLGTYYVHKDVSSLDSPPAFAAAVQPAVALFYRAPTITRIADIPMLEADYMRARALGAIVGPHFLPNPNERPSY